MIISIIKLTYQLKKHKPNNLQLIAFAFPLHRPTAVVAPVTQCVVEIGRPSFEAVTIVNEVPNSKEKPRDGD